MSGYNYRIVFQFMLKHLLPSFIYRQNLDTVGRFGANFRAISFLPLSFTCFATLLMTEKEKVGESERSIEEKIQIERER